MLSEPFTPQFLSQLETFRLRTRKEFLGSHPGSYSAPRRGTSLEFADYRKYSLGDDLRYVDWGIYARTDRLHQIVPRGGRSLRLYFHRRQRIDGFPHRRRKILARQSYRGGAFLCCLG